MASNDRIYSQIDPSLHLTRRQVDVLRRLRAGRLPKEIAAELDLSYHTVVEHIGGAMAALGAHSRIPLMNAVTRHRFLDVSQPLLSEQPADPATGVQ